MKHKMQKILLIVWIILILILTGFPTLETPEIARFPVDKIYHFIIFAILGLLEIKLLKTLNFFMLGSIVILVAEGQQLFIPGRHFEFFDIIAGLSGLVIIFFVFKMIRSFKDGISKA